MLRQALTVHNSAFEEMELPIWTESDELLRFVAGISRCCATVRLALQLAPFVFVRPGELRSAEWSEIDFAKSEWHIPATKMKMRGKRIVQLSRQAISLLRLTQPLTGACQYVFPSARSSRRPLSNVALLAALRRMGYPRGSLTVHGFRSTESTLLNEQGKNRDWIERQLAHGEQDGVRAAYNYADYLPQRKIMMQEWADYLDGLRQSTLAQPECPTRCDNALTRTTTPYLLARTLPLDDIPDTVAAEV